MIESEAQWQRFLHVIFKSTEPDEEIAARTALPVSEVRGYREQAEGKDIAKQFGNSSMPKHVVGFRYKRLPRWVLTKDIERARENYDAGTHEMCHGKGKVKGEDAYILYSIPRKLKRKVKRGQSLAYFSKVEE